MSKFSYLLNNHLPWSKSILKLLANLIKPGVYFYKRRWEELGFLVSFDKKILMFRQFRVSHENYEMPTSEYYIQNVQSNLSAFTNFLVAFFEDFSLYEHNSIDVYKTKNLGYIFINNSLNILLFNYQDSFPINENGKCKIEFPDNLYYEEYTYLISLNNDRSIHACLFNSLEEEIDKEIIQPISFEHYLIKENLSCDKKSGYILEFCPGDSLIINKKTRSECNTWQKKTSAFNHLFGDI